MRQLKSLNIKYLLIYPVVIFSLVVGFFPINPSIVSAACAAPATDYGTVTSTINIPATGSYRVWSRIQIPSATNNSYLLEIDGGTCYTVGGNSALPLNTWVWVDYQSGNTTNKINTASLTAGNHTVKMIGNSDGVLLDRLIFTQDTTGSNCNPPTGTGDACANPVNVAPTVTLSANPTSGIAPLNTTLTAVPADSDGTVKSVEFFRGSTSLGIKTAAPWTQSVTGLAAGTYSFTARVTDSNNAVTTSSAVSVNVTAQTTYGPGDTGNTPGVVDFEDLLAVLNNWNTSGKTRSQGDLVGTGGTVDFEDLLAVLNNWTR